MTHPTITPDNAEALARRVAAAYAALPGVTAVAWSGSRTRHVADEWSDIDLYIYAKEDISEEPRASLMRQLSDAGEIGNTFWEPSDNWIDRQSGIDVDVIYRTPQWIETQLRRVLIHFEASLGCSTCLWHNVGTSVPLEDPTGWYRDLQAWAALPYPLPLRDAIIAKNHPVLRRTLFSYMHQVESAVRRHDLISMNHRVASIFASYFDILFAMNLLPLPGEKRLVEQAVALCAKRPPDISRHIEAVLRAMGATATAGTEAPTDLIEQVHALLDDLDALLHGEGLI